MACAAQILDAEREAGAEASSSGSFYPEMWKHVRLVCGSREFRLSCTFLR